MVTLVTPQYLHCCLTVLTLKIGLSPSHHLEEKPGAGLHSAYLSMEFNASLTLGRGGLRGGQFPSLPETENLFSS